MGAADGVGAGLAQAEIAHLALLDQARHGADGILDRHVGIDTVDVIEVDVVDAETLQARVAGDRHIIRLAVDPATLAAGAADIAEFRSDEIFLAPAFHGAADELLVEAGGIGVGGIKEVYSNLGCAMNCRDGFRIVGHAVVRAHARTAEPDGGNA